jgi:hypothetical protein
MRGTNDLNTDKGEVGGSSPPRPTIHSKYVAILTFSLRGACSEKAICQKLAKSSHRLTLPSIRVGECGFRSFWTIRAAGAIDSRVSSMRLQCTHGYSPSHFQLSVIAEAHCPDTRAQCKSFGSRLSRTAHSGSGKTPGGRPSKPGPVSRSIGTTWQPVHRRDSLSTGHSSAGSGHGRNFAYHNAGGSKELDGCRMARNRSESSIPCN